MSTRQNDYNYTTLESDASKEEQAAPSKIAKPHLVCNAAGWNTLSKLL